MQNELDRAKLHPDVLRNLAKNKQLKKAGAYSEDNPPPYPVTSVNGMVGDVVIEGGGGGGGLPSGGYNDDILIKDSSAQLGAKWATPANAVEQDNTLPITSAAVYTEIGNINALLATI